MNAHQRRVAFRKQYPHPMVELRGDKVLVLASRSFWRRALRHPKLRALYAEWVAQGRPEPDHFRHTPLT